MFKAYAVLLCALPVSALAADAAAPQGLDKVMAYAGTWKTEIRHLDTPFSKAGSEAMTLKNDCWRSGGFLACNQIVDGDSKALLVFLYDAKGDVYASYPIVAGSGDVHPGKLIIHGKVWTFPWDDNEGGKTTHFRVVNTWSSADSIEFRQEYSTDGVQWTLMADGHDTRIK
jgi:hypothetical protein